MGLVDEKVWDRVYFYLDMMNLPYKDVGEKMERHVVLLYQSTQIHIVSGEDNIVFVADVVEEVQESSELLKFLLTEGAKPFGNVRFDENKVYIGYSLPVETLDFNIFATVLYQFSNYADWLDDEIKKRFGGKRMQDLVKNIDEEDQSTQRRIGFK